MTWNHGYDDEAARSGDFAQDDADHSASFNQDIFPDDEFHDDAYHDDAYHDDVYDTGVYDNGVYHEGAFDDGYVNDGYADDAGWYAEPHEYPADADAGHADEGPAGPSRLGLIWLRWRPVLVRGGVGMVVMGALVALAWIGGRLVFNADDDGGTASAPSAVPDVATVPSGSDWPPGIVPVPHTVPAMIKNALVETSEQHGYAFEGRAGERWRVTVEARDEALDPAFELFTPDGMVFAAADDMASGALDAETVVTLPETGTYRLIVRSSRGGTTIGPYLLTVWPVN